MNTRVAKLMHIKTRKKIMAVIPAFNEAGSIAKVIAELRAITFDQCNLELVVVNDGSKDATQAEVQATGATLVNLPYNMGIGVSVQTGFLYALSHGADYVVQVDGDGQHIAAEIEKLFPPILNAKADVVVGTRFHGDSVDGKKSTTFLRWFVGRGLAFVIRVLTGQSLTDTTSGFRLFNRNAAEFVAKNYPDDYPEVQILVMLARRGFRIEEVAVKMREREHGTSSINWWRSVYYVFKVLFASFMDRVRR